MSESLFYLVVMDTVEGENQSAAEDSSDESVILPPINSEVTINDTIFTLLAQMYESIGETTSTWGSEVKKIPHPLAEKAYLDQNKKLLLENWEKYKTEYYESLVSISSKTNVLISHLYPFYEKLYQGCLERSEIVSYGFTESSLSLMAKQITCIRILMDEYFFLAHYHMPSWRIYSSTNAPKTKTPMEVPFFYEICRVRAIGDILTKLTRLLVQQVDGRPKNVSSLSTLNSFEILPPNVDKWSYVSGMSRKEPGELLVPYYSQAQLETSFKHFFLRANLISYHSDIGAYLDELWARMSWFVMAPGKGDVFDSVEFRVKMNEDQMANQVEDSFILNTEGGTNMKERLFQDKAVLYICNKPFIYRHILRYWEMLAKLSYRTFIFSTKRVYDNSNGIKILSKWLQERLNKKFEKVANQMRPQVFTEYSNLLIPPSDGEWCRQNAGLQYINENSIWMILYPNLKSFAAALAAKDVKTIYYKPTSAEGSIMEFIVLRLFGMVMGDDLPFAKYYVYDQSKLLEHLDQLKDVIHMPTIVQSFNRYGVLYRGKDKTQRPILYEYKSIFDTLAAWMLIMLSDFTQEAATFVLVKVIQMQRTDLLTLTHIGEKTQTVKTHEFSTMQTKNDNDTDVGTVEDRNSAFF